MTSERCASAGRSFEQSDVTDQRRRDDARAGSRHDVREGV